MHAHITKAAVKRSGGGEETTTQDYYYGTGLHWEKTQQTAELVFSPPYLSQPWYTPGAVTTISI